MKLVIKLIAGNWNDVATFVNQWDLAENVVSISPMFGNYTQVALKLPSDKVTYLESVGAL